MLQELKCPHCNASHNYDCYDDLIITCETCKMEYLCWYDFKEKKFVASCGRELWYVKNPNRNIYVPGK